MNVVVIAKEPFNTYTYTGVTNIAYSNGNYVITVSSETYSYSKEDYDIALF